MTRKRGGATVPCPYCRLRRRGRNPSAQPTRVLKTRRARDDLSVVERRRVCERGHTFWTTERPHLKETVS